jgi:hypothetical protein
VRTDALILAGMVFALRLVRRKLDVAQFATLSILALGATSPSTISAAAMAGSHCSTTPSKEV